MANENVQCFIIPLLTRTVTSMFDIGHLAPNTKCSLEVKVESHVEKKEDANRDNLYVVETVVCCFNNDCRFRVLVGLETTLLASGTLEEISEAIRQNIREDIFGRAEQAIFQITSVHGCPLKIYLNKYIKQKESEGECL